MTPLHRSLTARLGPRAALVALCLIYIALIVGSFLALGAGETRVIHYLDAF